MSNAQVLYNKGEDLWLKSNSEDKEQQKKSLLIAVSYLQQAIKADPTKSYVYSTLGRVLLALGELEKAISHANTALRLNTYEFDAYYILWLIAFNEFVEKGGFEAKAKTKVSWGWLLLGAFLNPDAAGSQIGKHYGEKITKGVLSRDATRKMHQAYSGMVSSFTWGINKNLDINSIEFMARVLLDHADDMNYSGYSIKQVYQTIVHGLSTRINCGRLEDQIRDLQAQAEGALSLL
jgi:tetratricopeptide (TPR) repeat protein